MNDRKEQLMLMMLADNGPDFMALSDANGRVMYINKTGRQLTGIEPQDKRIKINDGFDTDI